MQLFILFWGEIQVIFFFDPSWFIPCCFMSDWLRLFPSAKPRSQPCLQGALERVHQDDNVELERWGQGHGTVLEGSARIYHNYTFQRLEMLGNCLSLPVRSGHSTTINFTRSAKNTESMITGSPLLQKCIPALQPWESQAGGYCPVPPTRFWQSESLGLSIVWEQGQASCWSQGETVCRSKKMMGRPLLSPREYQKTNILKRKFEKSPGKPCQHCWKCCSIACCTTGLSICKDLPQKDIYHLLSCV